MPTDEMLALCLQLALGEGPDNSYMAALHIMYYVEQGTSIPEDWRSVNSARYRDDLSCGEEWMEESLEANGARALAAFKRRHPDYQVG